MLSTLELAPGKLGMTSKKIQTSNDDNRPSVSEPAEIRSYEETLIAGQLRTYNSAFPHPHDLQQYEVLNPGTTDRLLRLMEDKHKHKSAQEQKALDAEIRLKTRGQIAAFIFIPFGLIAALAGGWAIGEDLGIAIAVFSLVPIVGGLLYAKLTGD